MKYTFNDKQYQGTPDEIHAFISLEKLSDPAEVPYESATDPYAPFENVINESEKLRQELARDPSYNPFGGVVPPKEPEPDMDSAKIATAEKDTGVELI